MNDLTHQVGELVRSHPSQATIGVGVAGVGVVNITTQEQAQQIAHIVVEQSHWYDPIWDPIWNFLPWPELAAVLGACYTMYHILRICKESIRKSKD